MKLQELREAAGLSKSEVARRLSVDLSTVCHWERGAAVPRTDKLPALADMLGCSIDNLFGREPQTGSDGLRQEEPQAARQNSA